MTPEPAASDPAFRRHDHAACRAEAVAAADRLCVERGLRLTPVRRRALEILLEEHRALGAYALLDRFRAEGLGSQPPVAYRALDFLVSTGLAHRVERLNAYVACPSPASGCAPALLICGECGKVAEAPADGVCSAVAEAAAALGFEARRTTIEIEGLCPACRDAA